jgi:hypothetical protein
MNESSNYEEQRRLYPLLPTQLDVSTFLFSSKQSIGLPRRLVSLLRRLITLLARLSLCGLNTLLRGYFTTLTDLRNRAANCPTTLLKYHTRIPKC